MRSPVYMALVSPKKYFQTQAVELLLSDHIKIQIQFSASNN